MFDIGGGELFLILLCVLVLFGPKKLPELAQSLGRGIREFKKAQREFTDHINSAIEQEHQRNTGTVARPVSRPVVTPTSPPIAITGGEEGESEMHVPPVPQAERQMEPVTPHEAEIPTHQHATEMPGHQADEHAARA
ncbi:MAG: twin-arginine translocase TatA/TatE family subunit [Chlorobi bacterium]|nr:twin-arginine translocase TatA/TatE family subunit [Chlorobiota bacterium]